MYREGKPAAVLDLGCGTGLPLLRVAPYCQRYVGLDPSERTLEGLRAAVTRAGLRNVELSCGEATDVTRFAGQRFDLVVANSVSQYFPNADYLARTVRNALGAIRPGGRVVIGDVRDLALLWEFHTAVVLARSSPDTHAAAVLELVAERVEHEGQLVVSPRWFAMHATPSQMEVEVRPRRGWHRNEMNDFRFDVVLHTPGAVTRIDIVRWLDWSTDVVGIDRLSALLSECREPIGIRRVRNARTAGVSAVLAVLRSGGTETVVDLRNLRQEQDRKAVHPEALVEVASTHGCRIHFDRGAAQRDGAIDVVFFPPDTADRALPRFDIPDATSQPLITDPAGYRITTAALTNVVPQLRPPR